MTQELIAGGDLLDDVKVSLTLHVTPLGVAVRWYTRVFGIEPVNRGTDVSATGDSTSFAAFVLAGFKVFLNGARGPDFSCAQHHHPPTLVFMTRRPLAELRRTLFARGAFFRDGDVVDGFPADADGVRTGASAAFLWLYDPDGNRMQFCRVLGGRIPLAAG